jgi:NAD(P)-dependent dehydrogenase (short-subunit alcohol dehydrogenase family)
MSRTYVVTGSASGMGAATKRRLEGHGYRVIGVDLHAADVAADLSTGDGRGAMAAGVERLAGKSIDGVIACAGVSWSGAGAETAKRIAYDRSEIAVRVNYFGAVATLELLRPLLARGTDPRAVVVASIAALYPGTPADLVDACLSGDEAHAADIAAGCEPKVAYAASKLALARWVRRAAPSAAWAGAGIPLNAVGPARIQTAMSLPPSPEFDRALPMPLHGPGRPEDAAALLDWLTGPENVLVTGQLILLDGGWDATTRGDDVFT